MILRQPYAASGKKPSELSLFHLLDPAVLADPYPLYNRLLSESPVSWDPYMHSWVVTRYADVVRVLRDFSAERIRTEEQLEALELAELNPMARIMVKQMLFMDPPMHKRIRGLCAAAFTTQRVEALRSHIRDIVRDMLAKIREKGKGSMELISELAEPLPCIVTAEMLGVPTSDHRRLKQWSQDFAEMLGNFEHDAECVPRILKSTEEMTAYFRAAMRKENLRPDGLVGSLTQAEVDGDRLTEDEVIANCIITMIGGQETTTNLVASGMLTLIRNPAELEKLRNNLSLIPSAIEELLRYESPVQNTARIAPVDVEFDGHLIKKGQAVVVVLAAANRDPGRFPDPDRFDISREDNRHLAFGWGAHFCFGGPLARMEAQVVFEELLTTFSDLTVDGSPLIWRSNLGIRGLTALPINYSETRNSVPTGALNATAAEAS
jgi:pimeloyl-[acyl-carrier protein] synthase